MGGKETTRQVNTWATCCLTKADITSTAPESNLYYQWHNNFPTWTPQLQRHNRDNRHRLQQSLDWMGHMGTLLKLS